MDRFQDIPFPDPFRTGCIEIYIGKTVAFFFEYPQAQHMGDHEGHILVVTNKAQQLLRFIFGIQMDKYG